MYNLKGPARVTTMYEKVYQPGFYTERVWGALLKRKQHLINVVNT